MPAYQCRRRPCPVLALPGSSGWWSPARMARWHGNQFDTHARPGANKASPACYTVMTTMCLPIPPHLLDHAEVDQGPRVPRLVVLHGTESHRPWIRMPVELARTLACSPVGPAVWRSGRRPQPDNSQHTHPRGQRQFQGSLLALDRPTLRKTGGSSGAPGGSRASCQSPIFNRHRTCHTATDIERHTPCVSCLSCIDGHRSRRLCERAGTMTELADCCGLLPARPCTHL